MIPTIPTQVGHKEQRNDVNLFGIDFDRISRIILPECRDTN
jgi:hypothetical protein